MKSPKRKLVVARIAAANDAKLALSCREDSKWQQADEGKHEKLVRIRLRNNLKTRNLTNIFVPLKSFSSNAASESSNICIIF